MAVHLAGQHSVGVLATAPLITHEDCPRHVPRIAGELGLVLEPPQGVEDVHPGVQFLQAGGRRHTRVHKAGFGWQRCLVGRLCQAGSGGSSRQAGWQTGRLAAAAVAGWLTGRLAGGGSIGVWLFGWRLGE